MIRISDIAGAAGWARPAASSSSRAGDLHDPSTWFDVDAAGAEVRISGDPGPASRGLSVEQHAGRVLGLLCGERDDAD